MGARVAMAIVAVCGILSVIHFSNADTPDDIPYFSKNNDSAGIHAKKNCPEVMPGIPVAPVMQGLKGINLHAYIHNKELLAKTDYPNELEPEKLASLYVPQIEKMLFGIVARDEKCNVPTIKVVPPTSIFEMVSTPNTLTINVRVDIIEDLKPKIAVVTTSYYRPEHAQGDYGIVSLASNVTAFPLTLSPKEFEARLHQFVASSIKQPVMGEP
ncbi:MAG: hypothetical protein PSY14_08525 [bacterium]|nr:hypothetical protein [bacterium]